MPENTPEPVQDSIGKLVERMEIFEPQIDAAFGASNREKLSDIAHQEEALIEEEKKRTSKELADAQAYLLEAIKEYGDTTAEVVHARQEIEYWQEVAKRLDGYQDEVKKYFDDLEAKMQVPTSSAPESSPKTIAEEVDEFREYVARVKKELKEKTIAKIKSQIE